MPQIIRLGPTLILLAVLLSCRATPERSSRAEILALPYSEFDQAYGDGWRAVFDSGQGLVAVALMEDYLRVHKDLTLAQRKFLHLHAGQILALQGKNLRALKHLDEAMSHQQTPDLWPDWDDFITATKAFLRHDRPALLAARDRLVATRPPRLKLADRFIEKFGRSYADVIWWIRVCPTIAVSKDASPRQRDAAARLAKAFDGVVTAETNSSSTWLELRSFSPRDIPKGYVIIHSAEGTSITASDLQWLDEAVQRFIRSARKINGVWEAPFGSMSNYELNPSRRR